MECQLVIDNNRSNESNANNAEDSGKVELVPRRCPGGGRRLVWWRGERRWERGEWLERIVEVEEEREGGEASGGPLLDVVEEIAGEKASGWRYMP